VLSYVHRHSLAPDDANLQFPDSERARVIRASFALAELVHAGQSRDKVDPKIGYISHPIMVYDILSRLGETDPALLASAFLHDALEQPEYRGRPDRLHEELLVALEKEGISPSHAVALADDIYQLVYEVTNPKVLPKNKELYQIDRVEGMSLRGKKLKIADQAASLVCNLTMANDPREIPYDKERGFTEKASSLVLSILQSVQANPQEKAALEPYDRFFANTLTQALQLFLKPDADRRDIAPVRREVRRAFDFSALFGGPTRTMLPDAVQRTVKERLFLYDELTLPELLESGRALGLIRVDYDAMGRVARFYMHGSPEPGQEVEANRLQQQFTAEIRQKLRWSGAYSETGVDQVQAALLHPGDLAIGDSFRVYHLHPPMRHDAFAAAAANAKVCSRGDAQLISRMGAHQRKRYDNEQGTAR
jgi:hypothetical protein